MLSEHKFSWLQLFKFVLYEHVLSEFVFFPFTNDQNTIYRTIINEHGFMNSEHEISEFWLPKHVFTQNCFSTTHSFMTYFPNMYSWACIVWICVLRRQFIRTQIIRFAHINYFPNMHSPSMNSPNAHFLKCIFWTFLIRTCITWAHISGPYIARI